MATGNDDKREQPTASNVELQPAPPGERQEANVDEKQKLNELFNALDEIVNPNGKRYLLSQKAQHKKRPKLTEDYGYLLQVMIPSRTNANANNRFGREIGNVPENRPVVNNQSRDYIKDELERRVALAKIRALLREMDEILQNIKDDTQDILQEPRERINFVNPLGYRRMGGDHESASGSNVTRRL